MKSFLGLAICSLLGMTSLTAAEVELTIEPVDGVYHMFTRPFPKTGEATDPVTLKMTLKSSDAKAHKASIAFKVLDVLKNPVAWNKDLQVDVPADGKPVTADVPFSVGMGYYSITAEVKTEGGTASAWTDLGIIPPSHPGVRPDSFFSSNTSGIRCGMEAKLLTAIGVKVQRVHFQPEVAEKDWGKRAPNDKPMAMDYKRLDDSFNEIKAQGQWVLPIVGYALQGQGYAGKSELANELGMLGPPRDMKEFIVNWEQILRHYPEVTTYEFWNEPWIFGWTWAATPKEYREYQKAWCEMALKVNPKYQIIAGNSSMFCEDNIEQDQSCYKDLLVGTTHHPYGYSTGAATFRQGDQFRSMDYGMQVTRRMGLKYYYLTEGGTEYTSPQPPEIVELEKQIKDAKGDEKKTLENQLNKLRRLIPYPKNNFENACKIVQYGIHQALIGGFQTNQQWGIGYGGEWTNSNTSIAVMTHFLEDRPIVADIWPENQLLVGAIFANPKFITTKVKALLRAAELTARWDVKIPDDRANDTTKVAVVYAVTGPDSDNLDSKGKITLDNADGALTAYDMVGREIASNGGKLVVPLCSAPSYILSNKLDVVELWVRVSRGIVSDVTPINLYALSLLQPAGEAQKLGVRVENQMNVPVTGEMTVKMAGQETGKTTFELAGGKLATVEVPWPAAKVSPLNQYEVEISATVKTADGRALQNVSRKQIIQVARFVKKTLKPSGSLDACKDLTPVLLDSRVLRKDVDLTQYLLNPGMDKPTGAGDEKRIVTRVYTAYDDENVYLTVAVNEAEFKCNAGTPAIKGRGEKKTDLPYRNGMPDGLNHICNSGDMLQLGFGFRDRVPGFGRQMDDPYAWKGNFYDTDYVYHAHASTEGPMLMRQWGPAGHRRNAYQCEAVPGVEPVPGAQIKITRNEEKQLTLYEIAIPRSELKLFDPSKGVFRFSFLVANNEGLGEMNWAEAAGVFDFWRNMGSFAPTWMQRLPAETFFGVEK